MACCDDRSRIIYDRSLLLEAPPRARYAENGAALYHLHTKEIIHHVLAVLVRLPLAVVFAC